MSNEKKELFKVIGKFFVDNSRKALEELSNAPITLEFFNSMIDDLCSHYSVRNGEDYRALVDQLGHLLDQYFGADHEQIVAWLETENPELGNAKPIELVFVGFGKSVVEFVEGLIEENSTTQV